MISGAISGDARTGKPRDLPRGPHTLTREQVAESQRRRLLDAMAQAVADRGYTSTTVANVIEDAGVSRKAFYAHFANREECFLAACDIAIEAEVEKISRASLSSPELELKAEQAIAILFDQVRANPPLIRLALVEIRALGEQGLVRRERRLQAHEQLLRRSLGFSARRKMEPSPLLRALVGGINEILYDVASRHRWPHRRELVPAISSWAITYSSPPPEILVPPRTKAGRPQTSGGGGRAPGTLSPPPPSNKQRGLRGENTSSHSFVVHSQRERVLDAVATLSATNGYASVTVREIAEHAAISMETFYEHFTSKEDAFLVAFELGHGKALAITERAYQSAATWGEGVRAAIDALFDFLSCEPTFARLALKEALVATPRIYALALKGVAAFTHILAPGLDSIESESASQELTLDAVRGGIAELCLTYATQEHPEAIRDVVAPATYFALAPFIGNKDAERIARGEAPRGRGRET